MLTRNFSRPSNLIPLAYADIDADDAPNTGYASGGATRLQGGHEGFFIDQFGSRWMRYCQNKSSSAMALGDVVRVIADVTFTDPDSSTTTSITKAATFTANAHPGKLVTNDTAGAAGVAPEGQSAIIVSNTAALLTLDSDYPFSAVPGIAAGDAYRIWSPGWHLDDAGAAVAARLVAGVVVGANGISQGNFGWVQYHGICPVAAVDAAAIVAGAAVVTAATAKFKTIGGGAANAVIGYAPNTVNATNSGFAPIFLTLAGRAAQAV